MVNKTIANNIHRINTVTALLFFIAGAVLYFYIYQDYFFYLVDDSGVEILQVRNFRPWPLTPFIQAYELDVIESFYGYFMLPFIKLFGDDIAIFKLGMGLCFAASASFFFILLTRMFNLSVAVLVGVAYLTSAYTIWYPSLLLRNAFSPLFVIGVLLGLLDLYNNKTKRGCCVIILLSFFALMTYSSLKVIIPALLASACIAGILLQKNIRVVVLVVICGVTVCLMTAALFYFGRIRTDLLLRGSYMLLNTDLYKDPSVFSYLTYFGRSFILPVYENHNGFLAEATHFMFNRSMLNLGLYGFWALGLIVVAISVFKKRESMAFVCLATLLLSSLVLCLGGPSLKTHFALIPLTFIIIAYGINAIYQFFSFKRIIVVILGVWVLTVGYLESESLKKMLVDNKYKPDASSQDLGLYLTKHDQEFDFVFWEGWGSSIMRANYPNWATKTEFLYSSDSALLDQKINNLPKSKSRLLVVAVKDSEIYKQMMKNPRFCFVTYINDSVYSSLFASCENNTHQPNVE